MKSPPVFSSMEKLMITVLGSFLLVMTNLLAGRCIAFPSEDRCINSRMPLEDQARRTSTDSAMRIGGKI